MPQPSTAPRATRWAAGLDERCALGEGFEAKASLLYSDYKDWCTESGEAVLSLTAFCIRVAERGVTKQKRRDGWYYLGVRLRSVTGCD